MAAGTMFGYTFSTDDSPSTTAVGATVVILLSLLLMLLPWIREQYQIVQLVEKLPGPALKNHPYPWLVELGTILSAPLIKFGKESIPDVFYPILIKPSLEYEQQGLYRLWIFNPYRLPFLARALIVVYDPELVKDIVGPAAYGKFQKGRGTRAAEPVAGNSFLSLPDGMAWKHQRKLASPAFGRDVLERTTQVCARLLEQYVFPQWDTTTTEKVDAMTQQDVHVEVWMKTFILDVLGLVAFSCNFQGLESFREDGHYDEDEEENNNNNLGDAFNIIVKECCVRSRVPLRKYYPKFLQRKFHAASEKLNGTIIRIVEERMKADEQGSGFQGDLLAQLVKKDEDGKRLSKDIILGNVKLFLFAGHETTASTLSYTLWHLAKHPQVQRKLQHELDRLFASMDDDKYPSYAELRDLAFLDAVVKETLRLNPGGGIEREAVSDMTIGKGRFVLPKGIPIYIYPWTSHRHPAYWERPDDFVPERFLNPRYALDESQDLKRPFFPFSLGPRSCIGQQLAMVEVRSTLAHILYRYDLECSPDAAEPIPATTLTISPHEVKLRIKRRNV